MWKTNCKIFSLYHTFNGSSLTANYAVLLQGRMQHFGKMTSNRLSSWSTTSLSHLVPPPRTFLRNQNYFTFSQPSCLYRSSTSTQRLFCVPLPCKSVQKRQIGLPKKTSKRVRYILGTFLVGTPLLFYFTGFGMLLKLSLIGFGAVAAVAFGMRYLLTVGFRTFYTESITLIKAKERLIIQEIGQTPTYPKFSLKLFASLPIKNTSENLFIFGFPVGTKIGIGEIISFATCTKNTWKIIGVVLNYVDASGSKKKVTLFKGNGKIDPEFTTIDTTAEPVKYE